MGPLLSAGIARGGWAKTGRRWEIPLGTLVLADQPLQGEGTPPRLVCPSQRAPGPGTDLVPSCRASRRDCGPLGLTLQLEGKGPRLKAGDAAHGSARSTSLQLSGTAPSGLGVGSQGAKAASRAGKSGHVTWLGKSKRTACVWERGKSDVDNESPVSLTSLAHGRGACSEKEIVEKRGNGSCCVLGSSHCQPDSCPRLGAGSAIGPCRHPSRAFHWEIVR